MTEAITIPFATHPATYRVAVPYRFQMPNFTVSYEEMLRGLEPICEVLTFLEPVDVG